MKPETYGRYWADVYEQYVGGRGLAPAAAVSFLASLAGTGPALELGIGSGRVALPLIAAGVDVHGIDASEEMVALLRAKPGGDRIPVAVADYARFELGQRFSLVYGPYNAVLLLTSAADQRSCFQHVSRHLTENGRFVIEAERPELTGFVLNGRILVARVGQDHVELRVSQHRPAEQVITSQHVWISNSGIQLRPGAIRYASPTELDLMAIEAGLELEHRFGGWNREPYTDRSGAHVSVYKRRLS
jgi:SAM-dependent methyltransferase